MRYLVVSTILLTALFLSKFHRSFNYALILLDPSLLVYDSNLFLLNVYLLLMKYINILIPFYTQKYMVCAERSFELFRRIEDLISHLQIAPK